MVLARGGLAGSIITILIGGHCFPNPQPLMWPIQPILLIPVGFLVAQNTPGSICPDFSSILVPSEPLKCLENQRKTYAFPWFSYIPQNCSKIKKMLPWGAPGTSKWRSGAPEIASWDAIMKPMSSKIKPENAKMGSPSVKMGAQMGHGSSTCCSECF